MTNPQDSIKMRQKIAPFLLCLGIFNAMAQNTISRANDYFNKSYYADAIPLYEEVVQETKNAAILKKLADSYYHTFNMPSAARWYAYLIANYGSTVDEDYYFKLNQSLKAINKFDDATEVLANYYKEHGALKKLDYLYAATKYIENVAAIGNRYTISNLNLNTTKSEFGAMQIGNFLWYSAAQKQNGSKKFRWNNQNYLDLYQHPLEKIAVGDSLSSPLSRLINTKMHEAGFCITKDGKTLYFTRNNYLKGKRKTDKNKISNLKIYRANLVKNKWQNIEELPFNSDTFSNEHPALNADETKLYFASDRPGGYGSLDIYEVGVSKKGDFGIPKNLGNTINTSKKEQFPYLDKENTLYFSSNGHPGFGLLDVFSAKNRDGNFEKPNNLGLPVNSGYDDFSYVVNQDGTTGYFASNRLTGKGSDDIYSFTETKPLVIVDCKQYITGIISDKNTKKPIANAHVQLLDKHNTLLLAFTTLQDGYFKFKVGCETSYTISAKKEGYKANNKLVQTDKKRGATKDGSLPLLSLKAIKEAKVLALQIQQKKEQIRLKEKQLLTEEKAKKKRILAEKKAKKIALIKKQEIEKVKKAKATRIEQIIKDKNALVQEDGRTLIKTEEIHFDYSLWYLRRETRGRLGVVIQTMKDYPELVIEIGTHTDIRGNQNYNKTLSQKRANSVKEFLIKNGIAADRVIAKGYGETKPLVHCKTEESCSEEDHEWNRRCEFVVVDWDFFD